MLFFRFLQTGKLHYFRLTLIGSLSDDIINMFEICKEKTTRENVKNTCECYFHVSMETENSIKHMNCKYKEGKEYDLLWDYSW